MSEPKEPSLLLAFALAFVTACGLDGEGAGTPGSGQGGTGSGSICKPESGCQSCASCYDRCSCQTSDPKKCVPACANSGTSGGTGSGGSPTGGSSFGGSSFGGAGSGGASFGGSSFAGAGSGGTGGGSAGSGAGGFVAGAVTWLDYGEQNTQSNPGWSAYMTDVIRHLPLAYGNQYYDSDKVTYVHETTHGINAHLRNYFNNTGKKANAFYVGSNKAAIVVEPNIWKTDANSYVPVSLRDFRYDTYLVGATDWNDTPLYLFDEWVAYTDGTEAGVTLVKENKWNDGWRDSFGSLEFTVYALALAMAVEAKDPAYFSGYPQFREFLKWNAERAVSLYQECRIMPEFEWDKMDVYYQTIGSSADAASLRAFVKKTYGDAWAKQVFGF